MQTIMPEVVQNECFLSWPVICVILLLVTGPKWANYELLHHKNGLKLPLINLLSLMLYLHTIEKNSWYCTKFWNTLFSKAYASSAIYFNIHISLSKGTETNYVLSQMPRYHWYHMNSYIIQKADFFFFYLLIWLLGKLYLYYKGLCFTPRTNCSDNS